MPDKPRPVTRTLEEFLVIEMIGARWKLDRLEQMEKALWMTPEKINHRGFGSLLRERAAAERTYFRCAAELRKMHKLNSEPVLRLMEQASSCQTKLIQ